MIHKQTEKSVCTLANGAELVFNIVAGVLGNEVADTFNGSPLTRDVIYQSAQTQFQAAAAPLLKGK